MKAGLGLWSVRQEGYSSRQLRDAQAGAKVRVRHGASRWAKEVTPRDDGPARAGASQSYLPGAAALRLRLSWTMVQTSMASGRCSGEVTWAIRKILSAKGTFGCLLTIRFRLRSLASMCATRSDL